ncbi:MAG: ATP-binding protein, partial [Alphaproteobacteria bacterium]
PPNHGTGPRTMIETLEIKGFRAFEHLTMTGLGRINLLVGSNNSGKTSVLEAIYLLASGGDPLSIRRLLASRAEQFNDDNGPQETEYDVCHLFHGHELNIGTEFSILAKNICWDVAISIKDSGERVSTEQQMKSERRPPWRRESIEFSDSKYCITVRTRTDSCGYMLPLTHRGGLTESIARRNHERKFYYVNALEYVPTGSYSASNLVDMWSDIALSDEEKTIIEALSTIEPDVDRIAALMLPRFSNGSNGRGGFILRLKGAKRPLPIGSLGDGMWRMLALAIALVKAKDGILLVDEIDTGLHYTVLEKMWTLVAQTAKELNVQVFATTHSYDCIKSLATVCTENGYENNEVTVQRIEPGHDTPVSYTASVINAAAELHVEVR